MTAHCTAIGAIAILTACSSAAQAPRGPGANDDFGTIAEGYTAASVGGGLEAAWRMFSAPDFADECTKARAVDVRSLRATRPTIEARVGVPIPYGRIEVEALDSLGVLVPRVPIMIEAYMWSEVLDTQADHIAESSVTPREVGSTRLRVRTICDAPGGEAFVTIDVRP